MVLESAAFDSLEDCRRARDQHLGPALWIVPAEEIAGVLKWLRPADDACLAGSPAELIGYRLARLLAAPAARLDPLTGTLNRADFDRDAGEITAQAGADRHVALILADLDHFKAINDRCGHGVGDRVLQAVGAILRGTCGPEQVVARIGGEEFAVLLRGDQDDAFALAEAVRNEVAAHLEDDLPHVTLSLGVASADAPVSADVLFRQADEALYAAKARGRNTCVSYAELETASLESGDDIAVAGLQNRARVLSERVANYIALRSRRLLEKLRSEAETDGLTQFYTRRSLDRRLKLEFDRTRRRSEVLTVALVDIDHFGQINKTHGWPTGDKVLREVCDVMRQTVRSTDWVGRYGGEEFCVVMPGTSPDDARGVLERLRLAVEATRFTSTCGEPVSVTLSIGVTAREDRDAGPAAALERASVQALAAKRAGRNCVCVEATLSP